MIITANKAFTHTPMTEKEKCDCGELYDANYDSELLNERSRCQRLCHALNNLHPDQTDERQQLLTRLLGKVQHDCTIISPFYCDYGYRIEVGNHFFANFNCVILDAAPVTFGNHVFIGPHCGFYTAGHPLDPELRNQGLEYARPIRIGNNVWIGGGVSVLPGVTIGDNTMIGAGSVVTRNIPPGVVAAGNPCRVIRDLKC